MIPDVPLPSRPRPLRWLFLDLNSYFASVEQQVEPRLRGRPVLVAAVMTDSTCAIAASYEAKAFGIKTGTPIWEAKRRCPDVIVVPARHRLYVEYHNRIFAEVERHIPVTKVCSIDEVACRLLDNENGRDDAMALAQRIKRGIADAVGPHLKSSIGIAPTRLLAKIASDMQKPDGLTVIEAHELPQRLDVLALSDIPGVGRKMLQRLNRANIHSIADLIELGPKGAATRWGGAPGARLWWALMGYDHDEAASETRSISHSHVLAPRERRLEAARPIAMRLLLKAASRMRASGMATAELTLALRFEDGGKWAGHERLTPTQDSTTLLAALDRLWRQIAAPGDPRPHHVGVVLSQLQTAVAEQPLLFADPGGKLKLWQAIDTVNQKFNRNVVTLGSLAEGGASHIGTAIAFHHIPKDSEFND